METLVKVLGLIALGVIIAVVFSLPVMWLWNYVMPYLFNGVREIDFKHALALSILCGFLFGRTTNTNK